MPDINLKVNDKKVLLNEFMEGMLENLLLGYLKAAKGIPDYIIFISVRIDL